jgi:hypothetical protein
LVVNKAHSEKVDHDHQFHGKSNSRSSILGTKST